MNEAAAHTTLPLWASNVSAFFHIPNPRIFQLFIVSSTATFSLGTGMIIEWFCHGQHHPGYHWIVYFAPSMVILPLLMWIICLVFANIFRQKVQVQHVLPVVDLSESKQSSTQQPLQLQIQDGEVQFELVDALSDQEAMVEVGAVRDCTSDSTNRPEGTSLRSVEDQARRGKGDRSTLRRSLSLPLTRAPHDNSYMKRSLSFR